MLIECDTLDSKVTENFVLLSNEKLELFDESINIETLSTFTHAIAKKNCDPRDAFPRNISLALALMKTLHSNCKLTSRQFLARYYEPVLSIGSLLVSTIPGISHKRWCIYSVVSYPSL